MALPPIQQLNVGQSLQQGQVLAENEAKLQQQAQLQALQQQLAQEASQPGFDLDSSPTFQQMAAIEPVLASRSLQNFQALDDRRQKRTFMDNRKGIMLLKAGKKSEALKLIGNRISRLKAEAEKTGEKLDLSDTLEIQNDILSDNIDASIQKMSIVDDLGVESGFMKPLGGKKIQTPASADFQTFTRLQEEAAAETDPELKRQKELRVQQFGRRANFTRATEQQKSDIKVDEAARKEVKKSTAKRKAGFIDRGIEAADGVANIKRSLELLKTVETGGIDALKLGAKRFFGVEGADESELSANMGRSVLAQLKPIFGAAFTAAEGERLTKISEGFGKSTKANKRLLEQALRIADRAARRGIAAAEEQGDAFTADEIRAALEFKLDDIQQPTQTVQPPQGMGGFKILSVE